MGREGGCVPSPKSIRVLFFVFSVEREVGWDHGRALTTEPTSFVFPRGIYLALSMFVVCREWVQGVFPGKVQGEQRRGGLRHLSAQQQGRIQRLSRVQVSAYQYNVTKRTLI
jgi:hypothetical protein